MLEIILAAMAILSAFLLGKSMKKPAAIPPKEPAIIPPEINYADTRKMDDIAAPKPAATHSAQQLREWARDDVRHKE